MEWIGSIYKDQPIIVSWLLSIVGILLLLLPTVLTWKYCKNHVSKWEFTCSFIVFGALAIPLSFWLYFQFFLGPIRALIFGFIGLIMFMFHMAPFEMVTTDFLLEATDTESGNLGAGVSNNLLLGALLWSIVYGVLGFIIDIIVTKIKPSNKALKRDSAKNAAPLS